VSEALYGSLNLGDHVGDEPARVAANRARFETSMGAKPIFLNQVHGTDVLRIDAATPHASVADACLTTESGVACTIMVADCLPVLFTTRRGDVVAAAHAGWRGLAGQGGVGILENTFKHLRALAHTPPAQNAFEFIAWLGPCIGAQAFEVGDEVRSAFVAQHAPAAHMFQARPGGQWMADLAGLARQRLAVLGVTEVYGNDGSAAWCTVTQSARFFSHRRDRVSGRFAVSIWRDA
jgi:YfiH family protein